MTPFPVLGVGTPAENVVGQRPAWGSHLLQASGRRPVWRDNDRAAAGPAPSFAPPQQNKATTSHRPREQVRGDPDPSPAQAGLAAVLAVPEVDRPPAPKAAPASRAPRPRTSRLWRGQKPAPGRCGKRVWGNVEASGAPTPTRYQQPAPKSSHHFGIRRGTRLLGSVLRVS